MQVSNFLDQIKKKYRDLDLVIDFLSLKVKNFEVTAFTVSSGHSPSSSEQ
jgi:hypothetical protein